MSFSKRYNLVKHCNIQELQQRIVPMTVVRGDPCWNTRSSRAALSCTMCFAMITLMLAFEQRVIDIAPPIIFACLVPGSCFGVCVGIMIDRCIIDRRHNRELLGSIRALRYRADDDELLQQLLQETRLAPDKNLSQLCDQLEQGNNVFLLSSQQASIPHETYVNYTPL